MEGFEDIDNTVFNSMLDVVCMVNTGTMLMAHDMLFGDEEQGSVDPRTLPRSPRTLFVHSNAIYCIRRDYLGFNYEGSVPIFNDKQFVMFFGVGKRYFTTTFSRVLIDD